MKPHRSLLLLIAPLLISPLAWSQMNTIPGEFRTELPTLVSLGFEWKITGDDNRNARVDVTFRKAGEREWRKGLPLFRLQHELVTGGAPREGGGTFYNYTAPNMFAGSILNLDPDTAYECRFMLTDPDGVKGKAEKTVSVRTRKEPQPAEGGHVYHVYPFDSKGTRQQPAFSGLLAAYYLTADQSDHSNVSAPRVQPGDTILVHAGVYKDNRFIYGGFDRTIAAYGTPFDGTYYLTQSGTPDKPIVIKAADDGEVVFDGDGNQNLFNLLAANYTYFEGITVRNTNVAFLVGIKNIAGASGFTLKHSRLENIGRGVEDDWSGSKNFYIADNVFVGRHDPTKLQSWFTPAVWSKFPGYPAPITSEYAVKVYGQGHVVAFNYAVNWHDGIDIATYGNPDGTPNEIEDRVPVAIDFYNNDFSNMADNCIETDGGARNIRVFRNRCFNSAGGAFSAQPTFGGPLYFFQNLAYDTTTGGPLKFVDTPAGVLVYQNTFIGQGTRMGPAANVHFRNNLILGDGYTDAVLSLRTTTNYSTSDYNGFRPNPGVEDAFEWNSPPFEMAADFKGRGVTRHFKSLKDYSAAAKQEQHSVLVDFDVFENVRIPDKSDPQHLYKPADFDFRLKPGSAAVDAGISLPTINDDFTGRAPDLGAYELNRPLPHYGPR
ncbi:MAG TPA: hypothetical protein VHY84_14555 [Bryobacteraceae bacterium]|jgi:hypothetical protein|nr:hypothetical protein [Bryobacteraceae bacterium]